MQREIKIPIHLELTIVIEVDEPLEAFDARIREEARVHEAERKRLTKGNWKLEKNEGNTVNLGPSGDGNDDNGSGFNLNY